MTIFWLIIIIIIILEKVLLSFNHSVNEGVKIKKKAKRGVFVST